MSKKRIAVIAAGIVIGVMVTLIIFSFGRQKQPIKEYVDPGSGETVSNLPNTPEGEGGPVLLGISKLLDFGLSKDQLDGLKIAFKNFSQLSKPAYKEISITVKSIVVAPRDRESNETTERMSFDVMVDRKQAFFAKLEYFDLTAVRLYVYAKNDNRLVYDSKTIDLSQAEDKE